MTHALVSPHGSAASSRRSSIVKLDGPKDIGGGARWTASSALDGNPRTGTLPEHGFFYSPTSYLFHTRYESRPTLSIDLGRERWITGVEIRNRLDCCRERARALAVEVSRDGQSFVALAWHPRHDKDFGEWRTSFAPRAARFVRILGKDDPLHLAEVRSLGR